MCTKQKKIRTEKTYFQKKKGLFYSAEKDGFISLFAVTADAVKSFIVNIKTADIQVNNFRKKNSGKPKREIYLFVGKIA